MNLSPRVVKELFFEDRQRGARSEILLSESLDLMQSILLILEQRGVGHLPLATSLRDVCAKTQAHLDK